MLLCLGDILISVLNNRYFLISVLGVAALAILVTVFMSQRKTQDLKFLAPIGPGIERALRIR